MIDNYIMKISYHSIALYSCSKVMTAAGSGGYILSSNRIVFQLGPFRHGITFHKFKPTIFYVGNFLKFGNNQVKVFTPMKDTQVIIFSLILSPFLSA